ncbi:hypothetical protein CMK11_10005 [Candidatus Poribacteria bacterium]|nr:hypothetical protein [Candidatus Poribacteria bacterium]
MALRQLARGTETCAVAWPDGYRAESVAEDDAEEIGALLLRVGHPLHPECESGTAAGAMYYVTRLFDYHRADRNYALALRSSTIVREASTGRIAGVCLVGGGGSGGDDFSIYYIQVDPVHQNRGIGTAMIRRALTVLAEAGVPRFHLWREDDARAASLYDRLGFRPTGAVE